MITTIIDGVLLLFWLGLMPGLTRMPLDQEAEE